MHQRPHVDDESGWQAWREQWAIRQDTIYLNHGSFGLPPRAVQDCRLTWQRRLDGNPMDFFVRHAKHELLDVRQTLAGFVGAAVEGLLLVDNATYAMNVVANSFPLRAGEQVLLTDHEYGVVRRIWERKCAAVGADLETVHLPTPMQSAEEVADAVIGGVTPRTKLLVISHITSATAITMPLAAITRRAQLAGVAVCVDGPHAVAQLPLSLESLECDFYAASCHKWLSASFGTGFLYVNSRWRDCVEPPILSWGNINDTESIDNLWDEFWWLGTRDLTAPLTIPAAIRFLQRYGLDAFRARTHYLARYARERLLELTGLEPIVPDDVSFYGTMAHMPLPDGPTRPLQNALWGQYGIEVPIIDFAGRRWIRVSCHLYTLKRDIDRLIEALRQLL